MSASGMRCIMFSTLCSAQSLSWTLSTCTVAKDFFLVKEQLIDERGQRELPCGGQVRSGRAPQDGHHFAGGSMVSASPWSRCSVPLGRCTLFRQLPIQTEESVVPELNGEEFSQGLDSVGDGILCRRRRKLRVPVKQERVDFESRPHMFIGNAVQSQSMPRDGKLGTGRLATIFCHLLVGPEAWRAQRHVPFERIWTHVSWWVHLFLAHVRYLRGFEFGMPQHSGLETRVTMGPSSVLAIRRRCNTSVWRFWVDEWRHVWSVGSFSSSSLARRRRSSLGDISTTLPRLLSSSREPPLPSLGPHLPSLFPR